MVLFRISCGLPVPVAARLDIPGTAARLQAKVVLATLLVGS